MATNRSLENRHLHWIMDDTQTIHLVLNCKSAALLAAKVCPISKKMRKAEGGSAPLYAMPYLNKEGGQTIRHYEPQAQTESGHEAKRDFVGSKLS
ncbi:hypothetical protein CDAR_497131 [Caerostris darwini]|uniref:Uncharacterized protein n=1 Tax=Caerostris darwini TaxID=1538125 RepID=A0AAV4S1N5_9ARAC|nr:hypothetical protein CDAR_497131 [Caerostris darwini]